MAIVKRSHFVSRLVAGHAACIEMPQPTGVFPIGNYCAGAHDESAEEQTPAGLKRI
ncbi:hypothetical protein [Massilia sp. S19_KUP03_FR1]|uniref:hypothetical protein n=1 Tax=Massilia sp. S19_KUP03_FR1 TaxID=3025503 RepID=UPI002FCD9BAB